MGTIALIILAIVFYVAFKKPLHRIINAVVDVVDVNLGSVKELSNAGNKLAKEYSAAIDLNGLNRNYARILEINAQRKELGMQSLSEGEMSKMGINVEALNKALAANQIDGKVKDED